MKSAEMENVTHCSCPVVRHWLDRSDSPEVRLSVRVRVFVRPSSNFQLKQTTSQTAQHWMGQKRRSFRTDYAPTSLIMTNLRSLRMSRLFPFLILLEFFLIESAAFVFQKPPATPNKNAFLNDLDDESAFNVATKRRTQLVTEFIKENPTENPGSTKSFTPLAVGTWRIVYAPHIYTMGTLFQGSFDPVYYSLKPNGQMTSHARYNFPVIGSGWLSVSGTYGSEDEDRVCRVDFDKAWIKLLGSTSDEEPYGSLEEVPDSPIKGVIQKLGKLFFVESVSVFPVSYLDKDTIVFNFELLGTRICARKVGSA